MSSLLARRKFLAQIAASGALAGFAPSLAPALLSRDPSLDDPLEPFVPAPDDDDAKVFAAARRRLLFPANITYCNTGTLGAIPRDVMDALVKGLERLEHELPDWPYYGTGAEPLTGYQPFTEYREEAGAFINAPADEIAFTQNATMGMNFVANGLDLAPGDEILTTDQEHSGAIGPWLLKAKRYGVVVKQLPLSQATPRGPAGILEMFNDAFTPRTRVVMFCQITSSLGIRFPVREMCRLTRDKGALSVVDGAQSIGQMRVDVKDLGCDAFVGSPHKWLLAPKGTGILYIRRDVQPRIWNTLASAGFDDESLGAFRYQHFGTGSPAIMWGLRAALKHANAIGVDRIERWDRMLTTRLRDGLAKIPSARLSSPAHPDLAAAITTFAAGGKTGRELQDALWSKKIRVRAQGGDRGVRLSAHYYVGPADIDRVLETVRF